MEYSKGTYQYDFTTGFDKVFGGISGCVQLNESVYSMVAGDANGDGVVGISDKITFWQDKAGENGYHQSDLDLDIETNNRDKNNYWLPMIGKESQVPQ